MNFYERFNKLSHNTQGLIVLAAGTTLIMLSLYKGIPELTAIGVCFIGAGFMLQK